MPPAKTVLQSSQGERYKFVFIRSIYQVANG